VNKQWLIILFLLIPSLLFAQSQPKDWGKKKSSFQNSNKSNSSLSKNERKKPFQKPKRKTKYMFPEWSFDGGVGSSHSFTDIGGKGWEGKDLFTDVQLSTTTLDYTLFIEYRNRTRMGYALTFNYGKISGSDALSPNTSRYDRNNSFTNKIYELSLKHKFYFPINIYRNGWYYQEPLQVYLFYGLGAFYHNPILVDPSGEYKPKKSFSKIQPCIPLGSGIHYTFEKHIRVGFDFGWRMTFTDYIDGFTTDFSNRMDSYAFSSFFIGYAISKNKYKKRVTDTKRRFKLKVL
jgi:hypothetical protein